MKKTILLAAILASINLAHGATLNWTAANIYQPGTTTASADYVGYLFIIDQSSDFGAKTTTVDNITSLISSHGDFSEFVAATGKTVNGRLSGATGYNGTNFQAGDTLTAFAVIFDASDPSSAKNYIVTASKTASWRGSTGAQTLGFGSQANATWTPVPEPSTAVLALAGLALLLKRRRA